MQIISNDSTYIKRQTNYLRWTDLKMEVKFIHFLVLALFSFFSLLVISLYLSLIWVNNLNYTKHTQSWFSKQVLEVSLLILVDFSVFGFICVIFILWCNKTSVTLFTESSFYFCPDELNELPIFELVLCSWGGSLAQRLFIISVLL